MLRISATYSIGLARGQLSLKSVLTESQRGLQALLGKKWNERLRSFSEQSTMGLKSTIECWISRCGQQAPKLIVCRFGKIVET